LFYYKIFTWVSFMSPDFQCLECISSLQSVPLILTWSVQKSMVLPEMLCNISQFMRMSQTPYGI